MAREDEELPCDRYITNCSSDTERVRRINTDIVHKAIGWGYEAAKMKCQGGWASQPPHATATCACASHPGLGPSCVPTALPHANTFIPRMPTVQMPLPSPCTPQRMNVHARSAAGLTARHQPPTAPHPRCTNRRTALNRSLPPSANRRMTTRNAPSSLASPANLRMTNRSAP